MSREILSRTMHFLVKHIQHQH